MITPILEHYEQLVQDVSIPYEEKIAQLESEKNQYVMEFGNPVMELLSGNHTLEEIVNWPNVKEKNEAAVALLDECIAHVLEDREKTLRGLHAKSRHIFASYKACLDFKKKVLLMNLTGEPIPLIVDTFKAQRTSFIELLDDAPKDMVADVMQEIDTTNQPSNIAELVN